MPDNRQPTTDNQLQDTIAAIATPPGEGGVGIIRISGPEAPEIAEKVWRGNCRVEDFESHKLYYGEIVSPPLKKGRVREGSLKTSPGPSFVRRGEEAMDQALLVWMKAPHSYTGEEVIEIHAHGGPVLLQQILQILCREGARLARPGEFTERAFLNGRIDLTQAEAIADLIAGRSELALKLAADQLAGRLRDTIAAFRRQLIEMRARIEAMIDHPDEEDVVDLSHEEIGVPVMGLLGQIEDWLTLYEEGRRRREGIRVAIVGRPNVGKSSLLNCLLTEQRAIVHQDAGTTRDVVSETVTLNGLQVRFSDTAGLREGQGDVETEGVRRSWLEVERADIVLFVIDRTQPLTDEDQRLYQEIKAKPHLVVLNKCDLKTIVDIPPFEKGGLGGILGKTQIPLGSPLQMGDDSESAPETRQNILETSAKTEEGVSALKLALIDLSLPHGRCSDQLFIANLRHRSCLEKTCECLRAVLTGAQNKAGWELIAVDLMAACNHLGEITGEILHEEILSEIFSRFCLGK